MTTRASRSYSARTRERIQASKIADRLIQFFNGEIELSRDQIRVGMKLLDKVTLSLRSIEIDKAEPPEKPLRMMSMEELQLAVEGRFEEAGLIHKDRLAEMGYVHVDELDNHPGFTATS